MNLNTKREKSIKIDSTRITNYISKLWASGDFSISLIKQIKTKDKYKFTVASEKNQECSSTKEENPSGARDSSLKANLSDSLAQESENCSTSTKIVQTSPPSLVSSAELSQNAPKPYGDSGLNKRSRKRIESACCCLENRYGKKRLALGTLTLPQLDDDRMAWLSQKIGILCKRFFEWFKRTMERIGAPTENVFVVEMHPERSMLRSQFIPHIHFVYVCRSAKQVFLKKGKLFYIHANQFRKAWRNIIINSLREYKKKYNKYDLVSWKQGREVDVQVIRKSAAGYISKYMSKGGKFLATLKEKVAKNNGNSISFALPKQWWGSSRCLKKQVEDSIVELPVKLRNLALRLLEGQQENSPILYIFRPKYYNVYLDKEIPLATCGKIKRKLAARICFENTN